MAMHDIYFTIVFNLLPVWSPPKHLIKSLKYSFVNGTATNGDVNHYYSIESTLPKRRCHKIFWHISACCPHHIVFLCL